MIKQRGSEWRRWELHMHTPGTQKNDNYEGDSIEEKWQRFYNDIIDYIGDSEDVTKRISALGVTDYLSIDNYLKIVDDKKITDLIPFIFPNVELRVTPSGKNPINMHLLFNPDIQDKINDIFFSKLKFKYGDETYSATKSDLIRLGKALDSSYDDIKAEKEGRNYYVISLESLQEIYKENKTFRDNVVIVVANRSTDGASSLQDDQYKLVRNEIYRFANCIFSSNENDIKYFLGLGTDSEETLKEKIGGLKACVHGCDAHTNSKIFEPDDKRYCWIKSDCNFNGLKQIIYEPDSRVKICELRPENKLPYHTIDYIEFEHPDFLKDKIYFNENLNCIIGGKSTGKSLLLNSMANAIDCIQVNDKYKYLDKQKYVIDNINVYWKDGSVSNTKTNNSKKIVYIPQTYLNRLSDEFEEKTEIDKMIMDVILQNPKLQARYDKFNKDLNQTKIEIDKKIYDLINLDVQNKSIVDKKLEFGSLKSIENELKALRKKKSEISKNNELSDIDIDNYEKALSKNIELGKKIDFLKKEKIQLLTLDSLFLKKEIDLNIDSDIYDEIISEQLSEFSKINVDWLCKRDKILKDIDTEITKVDVDNTKALKTISDLKGKIESSEALHKLTELIKIEEAKISELKALDAQQKVILQKIEKLKNDIGNETANFDKLHIDIANEFNVEANKDLEGIEFVVKTPFRLKVFVENLEKIFNNKKLKLISTQPLEDMLPNDFDQGFFVNIITNVLNNNVTGLLKKDYTVENALRIILSDWFNTTFTIKLDDDEISGMSPGKKAIVLLRLLLNMKESYCPILIDQPEDDLDNRSIYKDLVQYIRKKKVDRQIIIVTHNANMVLGCDAEEIIVANQQGNDSQNEEYKFEYRCGSIENLYPLKDSSGHVRKGILNATGIQQHICSLLEGGKDAFNLRKNKYSTDNF